MKTLPMATVTLLVTTGLMTGCATSNDVRMAQAHYDAQISARQPACRMEARPGERIVIEGISALECWGGAQRVAQYTPQHHPAWSIAGNVLGTTLPILAMGYSSYKLADVVGSHAGDIATGSFNSDSRDMSFSNRGRVGSPNDSTHEPTIVEQPEPTIVEQPEPTIVEQPEPVITGGEE